MLTHQEYEKVLDIIHIAHTAQDRQQLFQAVFDKLQKIIGLSSAAYIPFDRATGEFQFDGHVVYKCSPTPLALYLKSYYSLDPYTQCGIHLKALNRAVKITDFISVSRYSETAYARDFAPLIPCFYEMNAILGSQGDPLGGIALHRQPHERDFTERHREVLNLVIPHLSLAIYKMDVLDAISSSQGIGVFLLGESGNPIFMNSAARKILKEAKLNTIPDLNLAAEPTIFRTQSNSYRIRTAQVRQHAKWKVVSLEPQPAGSNLQSKLAEYGLSKREMEVALWVVRGLSNREIADKLFICEQTVKDHIRHIFQQTQVQRRSELAARVMGFAQDAQ